MPDFDLNNQSGDRQYVPVATFSSMVRRINLQKRYILAILTCVGFILIYAIRSNLCTYKMDTGHVLSARGFGEMYFMISYFLIQIPTALLVNRFSPFKIFGLTILCSTALGLGTPLLVKLFNHSWLTYIGFVQGFFQGATFPAAHAMWQHWAPPIERSTIISIAYSGCFFGIAIGAAFSNLLCDILPSDNILIVYGFLGVMWYVLWTWLVYESPSAHSTITDAELQYLKQAIVNRNTTNNTPNSIPWKQLFGTKSTWALYVVLFCRSWTSIYLFQGDFSEFSFVHEFDVKFIIYPASIVAIFVPTVGFLSDLILTKTSKSVSYIRRLYISGGLLVELLIFLPGIFISRHIGPLVLDIFIGAFLYSCVISAFFTNHLDIAPKYAHFTMALSNMMNVSATFVLWMLPIHFPFAALEDITKQDDPYIMTDFFILASIFHIIGGLVYFSCGSGQIEKWSKSETEAEENRAVSFSNNSIGV